MKTQIEVMKAMIEVHRIYPNKCEFYFSIAIDAVCELCSTLEGSSGLQHIQVSGKPRLSLAAHRHHHYQHYHQRHHHFALFICLSAWEIVQMPLWHLPLCPALPPRPLCSADPFLVRPAPERALLCNFWGLLLLLLLLPLLFSPAAQRIVSFKF